MEEKLLDMALQNPTNAGVIAFAGFIAYMQFKTVRSMITMFKEEKKEIRTECERLRAEEAKRTDESNKRLAEISKSNNDLMLSHMQEFKLVIQDNTRTNESLKVLLETNKKTNELMQKIETKL